MVNCECKRKVQHAKLKQALLPFTTVFPMSRVHSNRFPCFRTGAILAVQNTELIKIHDQKLNDTRNLHARTCTLGSTMPYLINSAVVHNPPEQMAPFVAHFICSGITVSSNNLLCTQIKEPYVSQQSCSFLEKKLWAMTESREKS